jgi:hypothetical protein
MEGEVADVRSAEVHEYLYLWVRNDWIAVASDAGGWLDATILRRRTTAKRNLNHIQELAVDGPAPAGCRWLRSCPAPGP